MVENKKLTQHGTSVISSSKDSFAKDSLVFVSFISATVLAIMIASSFKSKWPEISQLKFNAFALISLVSFISNAVALFFVLKIKQKTYSILWFVVFIGSLMGLSGTELMTRLSQSPSGANYWMSMSTLSWVLMPIALFMFVLAFTDLKKALRNPYLFSLLSALALVFIFDDYRTQLTGVYSSTNLTHNAWGYAEKTGPLNIVLVIWITLMILASLNILRRFYTKSTNRSVREQTKLFLIAISIPLPAGVLTSGVLPALNINLVPPLTVACLTITSIVITYGIVHYDFLKFSLSLITESILSNMNDIVMCVRPDLSLMYINKNAEQTLGYGPEELSDHYLYELFTSIYTPEELARAITEGLTKGKDVIIDRIDLKTGSGTSMTARVSISKIENSSQELGYVVVITDITVLANTQSVIEKQVTERTMQLNSEHARLEAALDGLAVGVMITFVHDDKVMFNTAIQNILGLEAEHKKSHEANRVSLKKIIDQTGDLKVDLEKEINHCYSTGEYFSFNEIVYGEKCLNILGRPITTDNNQIIGVVIMFEDITERKIIDRSKDEFFSIASHELRTPLTAIRGNSSMIKDFYQDKVNDQTFDEMIDDIHTSSKRLIDIVSDFLDVSRLEQGKMQFNCVEFDISKVIESVIYEMAVVVKDKGLYLKHDKTLSNQMVYADQDKTKQIIYNLIGNALKFTETGGITVSIKQEEDILRISIIDTGKGIPEDKQALLFRKFQQASTSIITRDSTRGTGLGLYISRMLTEKMGGTMGLDKSEIGVGSTFSFTLPLHAPEGNTEKPKD